VIPATYPAPAYEPRPRTQTTPPQVSAVSVPPPRRRRLTARDPHPQLPRTRPTRTARPAQHGAAVGGPAAVGAMVAVFSGRVVMPRHCFKRLIRTVRRCCAACRLRGRRPVCALVSGDRDRCPDAALAQVFTDRAGGVSRAVGQSPLVRTRRREVATEQVSGAASLAAVRSSAAWHVASSCLSRARSWWPKAPSTAGSRRTYSERRSAFSGRANTGTNSRLRRCAAAGRSRSGMPPIGYGPGSAGSPDQAGPRAPAVVRPRGRPAGSRHRVRSRSMAA
jgi:hypothetical protein